MKTLKTILLAALTFGIIQTTQANDGTINIEKSEVIWNGKKVTGQHFGTIEIKSGHLEIHKGVLTGGAFTIDMASINSTDLDDKNKAKLEGHLKSDAFFNVAKFPTAKLNITKVKSGGKSGTYQVVGDLTIKSTTKPVSFTVVLNSTTATAEITIDRAEYDVRYGSGSFFDNLGDKTIYDDFILKVKLVLD